MSLGRTSPSVYAVAALAVAFGLVVGVSVGFVLAGGPESGQRTEMTGTSNTGTGCAESQPSGTGWAVVEHDAGGDSLLANLTVLHDANESVAVAFREETDGDYVAELSVVADDDAAAKGDPPEDCTPATVVDLTVGVPPEYDSIALVVDGETVLTVGPTDESFPRHWTLDTVDARD